MDTVVDGLPVGRFMIGQSRIAQEQAKRIWFDKLRRAQEKRVMSQSLCSLAARLQYDCCSFVADRTFTRQGSQVRTLHRPPENINKTTAYGAFRRLFCLSFEHCLGEAGEFHPAPRILTGSGCCLLESYVI